jgi:Flp pilus assembly pilin Flp
MLKHYIINTREALLRLRTDKDGVVSLEYVVVAACVVAVVITAFSAGGSLPGALTTGFTAITTAMGAL